MRSLPKPPRPCTAHLTGAFHSLFDWRKRGLSTLAGCPVTQSILARWGGFSQPYICKLEAGLTYPPAAMLPGVLFVYGIRTEAEFKRLWNGSRNWNELPLWQFARGEGSRVDLKAIDGKAVSA